jgi:hypothetical protein
VVVVVAIWGAAAALLFAGRGTDYRVSRPESAPSLTEPRYLDVTLDPRGRPYDVALPRVFKGRIVRRPLAVLHAPSRRVRFTGGEYAPGDLGDPQVVLAERPGRRYPVQAVWMDSTTPDWIDEIVGVVIVERNTPVARWRELHATAYGTDGGTGAIATVETPIDLGTYEELSEAVLAAWTKGRESFTADLDGSPGIDTIIFSNGYGDGGFPSIAGYDASGRRAAIVLWSVVVPWRLAFPIGQPPSQVTERENELAGCLVGRRTIEGWSGCRAQ